VAGEFVPLHLALRVRLAPHKEELNEYLEGVPHCSSRDFVLVVNIIVSELVTPG
jgi:hypothetical protein